jgi:peroxiredoxin
MKKPKAEQAEAKKPAEPAPWTPRYFVYGVAALLTAILVWLFIFALPHALAQVDQGHRLSAEAACHSLRPAPFNPVLGGFPVRAPDFTLKYYDGRELSLSQLRGQVVMVNFWATWCSTCVVEMPSMERLQKRMHGKPFRMLAVSVDEGWDDIRKFFPNGTSLEILLDQPRAVPKRYGTEKFPETFLIDADGNIRYYIISDRDWDRDEVVACLDALAS